MQRATTPFLCIAAPLLLLAGLALPLRAQQEQKPAANSGGAASQSNSKAALINESLLVGLPLNGRSYTQLATLEAGVSDPSAASASRGVGGGSLTVSGSRSFANVFLLDGTNIMDTSNRAPRSAAGVQLGSDAVLQVQVFATTYSADYGRGSGGVLNSITRSGTNEFHGTLFEYFRNSKLDARNFFDQGPEPPPFKRNQFGATFTGPIIKDRTYFTGSYEALLDRLNETQVDTFVDAEARQGIITNAQGQVLRIVPVNPSIKPYLDLIPLPQIKIGGGFGNLLQAGFFPTSEHFFAARIDHAITQRDSIFGRYSFDKANSDQSAGTALFGTRTTSRQQYLTMVLSHVFSPRLLTSFRFGYTRPVESGVGVTTLPETPKSLYFVKDAPQFGNIAVGGGASFGPPLTTPSGNTMNSFQYNSDVVAQRGSHAMKFGVDLHRYRWDVFSNSNKGANWAFSSVDTFLDGGSEGTSLTVALPGSDNSKAYRQTLTGLYVQDEYQMRENVQLSLGFRYEFATLLHDRLGRDAAIPDIRRDSAATVGKSLANNPSLKNFSPRISVAWSPLGSRGPAIRSGFGIYYDQILAYAFNDQKNAVPFYQTAIRTNFNATCSGRNPTCTFPDAIAAVQGAGSLPVLGQTLDYNNMTSPRVMRYDLSVQQRVARNTNLQLAYVGARGNHLLRAYEANLFPEPIVLPDGRLCFPPDAAVNPIVNPACPPVSSQRAAPVNPAFRGGITMLASDAQSFYNSFLLTADTRLSSALTMRGTYTFSRSVDDGSSFSAGGNQQFGPLRTQDRGLSDFDQRHRITINYFYSLPSAKGSASGFARVLRPLISNWRIGGITNFRTGTPTTAKINVRRAGYLYSATRPNLRPGFNNNPTSGVSAGCTDPLTGSVTLAAGTKLGTKDILFDRCAFSVPEPGMLGNVGRNTIIGPKILTFDMSVQKEISLGNGTRLQFRGEMFNVANHTSFRPPGASGATVFTGPGRYSDLAGHYFTTASTSRQIQFALRLSF
uniref:TonB-dependent receptor n=1 Tax=uncultured bacterium 246 TaxID=698384 RepID=E3T6F1_9BACT|nr:TonB-dependent receptor [uncultured bacterium 246]